MISTFLHRFGALTQCGFRFTIDDKTFTLTGFSSLSIPLISSLMRLLGIRLNRCKLPGLLYP